MMVRSAPSYRVSWSCRGRRSILGRGCMVLFAHRFRPAHYPLARVAADLKMTSAASGCGSLFSEFDGARPPATVRSNDDGAVGAELPGQLVLPRPAIDLGQGVHGPLRSPFSTGTLSLGAGRGGFENDVGCQRLRFSF